MKPLSVEDGTEKCGKPAASFIPRWGMSFACVLDKGHDGECRQGGTCFRHGPYIGQQCIRWPNCVEPSAELDEAIRKGANTKGVEDGMSDEQAVRQVYPDMVITRYPHALADNWIVWGCADPFSKVLGRGNTKAEALSDARSKLPKPAEDGIEAKFHNCGDEMCNRCGKCKGCEGCECVPNLDDLLRNLRPATPEELTAQRESYAKNYKPGPRQAMPFMPAAVPVEERTRDTRSAKQKMREDWQPNPVEWMTTIRNLLFELGMKEEMSNWRGRFDGWGAAFEWIKYHVKRSRDEAAEFKNFHRSLCERFGYIHDEQDWKRDQASLEEHIATLLAKPVPEERTAEMEQLMGTMRMAAERASVSMEKPCDYKWPKGELLSLPPYYCLRTYIAAASPENILKLLDHIEGKAK